MAMWDRSKKERRIFRWRERIRIKKDGVRT
jgi:hypothetical protein